MSQHFIAQLVVIGFTFFMLLNSAAVLVYLERKADPAAARAEYEAALKADPSSPTARAALDRLARR